jgi:UDP-glucose 4-epimerase
MKIVITGASGYIGSRLCLFLSKNGHDITAVCSSKIPQHKGWTEKIKNFIVGDIRDEIIVEQISDLKADILIHLISLDHHDSEKKPSFVSEINVQPTWNLLEACTAKGLKKFIYFSTIHVYGKNQNGIIDENQAVTPFNAYALTHALSEEICNYYNRKTVTECINIRLSNSYGEPVFFEAKCWSLIVNDLTRSAFENKKIILNGDGSPVRDFIHYSDICNTIDSLIENNIKNENTFHLSSSKSITMLDVAIKVKEVYFEIFGEEIPVFINKNERVTELVTNKNSSKENSILNTLIEKNSIKIEKKLKNGIYDLFRYLQNTL